MFHVPEKARIKKHPIPQMCSDESFGNNGCFQITLSNTSWAMIIASDGEGWDHVSVHIYNPINRLERTPTWAEMCKIKDLFWDDEDCVIQYHPSKSEYVNNHKFTLHLWKPTNGMQIPIPDSLMVGYK